MNTETITCTIKVKDIPTLTEETRETGVIYKLTNKVNGKIYIGQAKSYIQDHGKIIRHGLNGRWANHCHDSKKEEGNFCPNLYAALREHGEENFKHEILRIVPKYLLNGVEEYYINLENAMDEDIGYNTTITYFSGGGDNKKRIEKIKKTMKDKWTNDQEYVEKTQEANLEAVKSRAESGKTRKDKNKCLPPNVYKRSDRDGYDIRVMRNGETFITSVNDKNLSDEQLLAKATERAKEIENAMENNLSVPKYAKLMDHKGNEPPVGVTRFIGKTKKGYKAMYNCTIDGKTHRLTKEITNTDLTEDQKLQMAINVRKEMVENPNKFILEQAKRANGLDHNGNPLPDRINIGAFKNGLTGFKVRYKVDGKRKYKEFCANSKTMDEKLALAKQFVADNPE